MGDIFVKCANPQCRARLKAPASRMGKKIKCPKCAEAFVLSVAESSADPAPTAFAGTEKRPCGADGIPLDWEPGDVILDLYEVIKLPGTKHGYAEGGMGRVNLVRHREWQRDLAVKSVLPAKSTSVKDIENFKTEAEQWVDRIGLHPNIVACHYVRVLGGVPRVFIDYVDGGTLSEWIVSKRLYEGGPKVALERILDVAIQTAWGLHYVHELGLIHQDVKPLNVMMTVDGVAKITDFGLAGAKAVAFEGIDQRPAGAAMLATWRGMTPAYCSPEQAEIAAKKKAGTPREQLPKLTLRTDIWSWAVSVLHMFLGEIAWAAGQVAFVGLECEPDELHLPSMPIPIKDLLRSCFQKRPEDRPQDLMQAAESLRIIYEQVTGQSWQREKPKPDDLLADSCNNRAVSLFDLKKPEAAEHKWQEALRADPQHPEATYNWGLLQWRAGRGASDTALIQELRKVSNARGDPGRVNYLLGLVHLERGDHETAIRILTKAKEANTRRAEAESALELAKTHGQLPRIFEGHSGVVTSVAWSPDGRFALSGSDDKNMRLWEVSNGRCLRTFEAYRVRSVAWSPDGSVALAGGEGFLRLWDVSTGHFLRTFKGHTRRVNSVAFSPDGCCAISASDDDTLRLWEVPSGHCMRTLEGHKNSVDSVAWSPDGSFVLSGSSDNTLRLWEILTGKCVRTFEANSYI